MGHPNPRFAWRSRFSGFLYKMSRDEPCRTVVSQQGRYDGPFHWRNRKCRTDEFRRLQGFPDSYDIPHNSIVAVKQIGNSVAPPVARALGMALRFQIEGVQKFELPLLEADESLSFDKRKGVRARESGAKKKMQYSEISQLSFFNQRDEPSDFVDFSDLRRQGRSVITRSMDSGICLVQIVEDEKSSCVGELRLKFFGPVSKKLSSLDVSILADEFTAEHLVSMWQQAHKLVSEVTSFESLHPLWGHFTEPYPKFEAKFESSDLGDASQLQRIALSESRGGRLIPYDEISHLTTEPELFLKHGRDIGFDIRTSNTNRTIPEGVFRICYPFTLPKSLRNDYLWSPAGQSKRFDV